ncbi:MAG: N-acetylmuramoyl-L-alanine amidase [Herpetosiphonaceae bacterium]|nr:MAG: N-acetylmuramoyl-L-alanine amidase [Herpetosiphonaceae bacterium]
MCHSCDSPSRRSFLKTVLGIGTIVLIGGIDRHFAPVANATVSAPSIVGCSTWGAQSPKQPITVLSSRPTKIIVHHTDTANTTDYSLSQAYQLARNIQQWHFNRGWIDSGQHFMISRGGYVLEGRHRSLEVLQGGLYHVRGAHCDGQNDVAVGIENEGNYMSSQPPAALYDRLVALCAYICQQYGISSSQIYGHRDFNATDCPGDQLYALLPQLRQDVAARIGDGGSTRTWPIVQRGHSGERVKTVQYLLRARGYSITVDGIFGSGTESAVKSFQSSKGLTVDGIVGPQTWEALIITLRNGNTGEAVKAVQSQLRARGYNLTVDGIFGSGTESAVKSFQSSKGLTADGIVGPQTWNALVNS